MYYPRRSERVYRSCASQEVTFASVFRSLASLSLSLPSFFRSDLECWKALAWAGVVLHLILLLLYLGKVILYHTKVLSCRCGVCSKARGRYHSPPPPPRLPRKRCRSTRKKRCALATLMVRVMNQGGHLRAERTPRGALS